MLSIVCKVSFNANRNWLIQYLEFWVLVLTRAKTLTLGYSKHALISCKTPQGDGHVLFNILTKTEVNLVRIQVSLNFMFTYFKCFFFSLQDVIARPPEVQFLHSTSRCRCRCRCPCQWAFQNHTITRRLIRLTCSLFQSTASIRRS